MATQKCAALLVSGTRPRNSFASVDQQVPCVAQPSLMLPVPGVVDIQHLYLFRSWVIDAGYQDLVIRFKEG